MISAESIEQLKQRADIYEIVSQYLELRRAGANYTACCPFHNENTPSFVVNPQRNIFKCFGCGEGGDSISFIMKIENLAFGEAVEKLAMLCNFTLAYENKHSVDSAIFTHLERIARYYQTCADENIVNYLKNRGINAESIATFKIGFSGGGAEFVSFLRREQMPFEKLLEVGIIGRDNGRIYARFNNRIMFPIFDINGRVVGFGGRILSGEKSAKYINSQQSKIFNKSRLLYGYNFAKDAIFKERKIIVTEGYIDVIMLHQAGFKNAVATLGTALTELHLPLLSRGEVDILLCYDGDSAGVNAAFKASALLANKGGGVVIFEGGKDPADMVKEGRIDELKHLFSTPVPFIKFVLSQIAGRFDLKDPLQKEKALKEISAFMQTLSPILRESYKDFVANLLQISPHLLCVKSAARNAESRADSAFFSKEISAEDILLKSILEDNSLLDLALEYLSDDIFSKKDAFLALKRGDLNQDDLLGIAIDGNIRALGAEDFKEQVRLFLINAHQKILENLKQNDTPSDKIAIAFKINQKISLLKSGKLVRYEKY